MSELKRLQKKIVGLEAVLGLVKKDLLLRAEHVSPRPHVLQNSYGAKWAPAPNDESIVVGLSSSVWCLLNRYLKEKDNENKIVTEA